MLPNFSALLSAALVLLTPLVSANDVGSSDELVNGGRDLLTYPPKCYDFHEHSDCDDCYECVKKHPHKSYGYCKPIEHCCKKAEDCHGHPYNSKCYECKIEKYEHTGTCEPLTCDDGYYCTDDKCDPYKGCVYTPNNDKCKGKYPYNPCKTVICEAKSKYKGGCKEVPVPDKTHCTAKVECHYKKKKKDKKTICTKPGKCYHGVCKPYHHHG